MKIRFITALLLTLALFSSHLNGQNKQTLTFDKTVHDFGDIAMKGGPVTCTFEFTNTGDQPIVINHVAASCGCTTPGWTREPVAPGGRGFVKATYAPQGIMPFSKTLTVTSTGQPSAITLQIRGKVVDKLPTVEELFPVSYGILRAKTNQMAMTRMVQGSVRTDSIEIVNTGKEPITLGVSGVPAFVKVEAPAKLDAGQRAFIRYTVNASNKNKQEWGLLKAPVNILVNGKKVTTAGSPMELTVVIEDDFSKVNRVIAPVFFASNYTVNFGTLKKGESKTVEYEITNNGKSNLTIHKAAESSGTLKITAPTMVKPGEKAIVKAVLNTKKEQPGEKIYTIVLTTNAPNQPSANLLLTGKIE